MGHAGAERAAAGPLGVHMNPLVIARGIGKLVDALLADLHPLGIAQLTAHRGQHRGRRVKQHLVCDCVHAQALCELTDTTSPVMYEE